MARQRCEWPRTQASPPRGWSASIAGAALATMLLGAHVAARGRRVQTASCAASKSPIAAVCPRRRPRRGFDLQLQRSRTRRGCGVGADCLSSTSTSCWPTCAGLRVRHAFGCGARGGHSADARAPARRSRRLCLLPTRDRGRAGGRARFRCAHGARGAHPHPAPGCRRRPRRRGCCFPSCAKSWSCAASSCFQSSRSGITCPKRPS